MTAKQIFRATVLMAGPYGCVAMVQAASPGAVEFRKQVEPILKEYCYDCHGDGMDKGGVAFDEFNPDKDLNTSQDLWWRGLEEFAGGNDAATKEAAPVRRATCANRTWIKSACLRC